MVCLEIGYPKIHSFIIVPIMMAGLIPTICFSWLIPTNSTHTTRYDWWDWFLLKFPTNIAIYSDSQKTKKSWKPGAYGETSSNFHILGHLVFLGAGCYSWSSEHLPTSPSAFPLESRNALTKSSAKLSSIETFLAKAAISRCAWANFLSWRTAIPELLCNFNCMEWQAL